MLRRVLAFAIAAGMSGAAAGQSLHQPADQLTNPSIALSSSNSSVSSGNVRYADNFQLSEPAVIESIEWVGLVYSGGAPAAIAWVDIVIYTADGPSGRPGTQIYPPPPATATPMAAISADSLGVGPPITGAQQEHYHYSTPTMIPLEAGVYWLQIRPRMADPAFAFGWARHWGGAASLPGAAVRQSDAGAWEPASIELAFTLTLAPPGPIDTDGDGLSDADEALWNTNPEDPDTDDDGLSDGDEVAAMTDPLDPDTDGDTVSDGDEAAMGTDPLNPDTDGDLLHDGIDPSPTEFDSAGDFIAEGLIDLSEEVNMLATSDFAGVTSLGRAVRRAILSGAIGLSSLAVSWDLPLLAVIELETVIDLASAWITDPAARDSVIAQAEFYRDLLILLGS